MYPLLRPYISNNPLSQSLAIGVQVYFPEHWRVFYHFLAVRLAGRSPVGKGGEGR